MNREEILAKSRSENKNQDAFEREVIGRGGALAARIGLLVCCLISALEVIFADKVSFAGWTIYFSMLATIFVVKFIKMRKTHELFMAVLYLICCIFFFVLYLCNLAGVV